MYTVKNKEVFYFLDRYPTGYNEKPHWVRLESRQSLIRVLASILEFGRDGADNPYFNVDFSGNDNFERTIWEYCSHRDPKTGEYTHWNYYEKKRYLFTREDGSPVDVRIYENEVKAYKKGTPPTYHYSDKDRTTGCVHGQKLYRFKDKDRLYFFRASAVPHTGKCGWGNYTSPSQLGRHLREDVTRPRLKPCPYDTWDGPDRHRDRSWKTSFKCKHQWEKHLIRRSKQNGDVWVQEEEVC